MTYKVVKTESDVLSFEKALSKEYIIGVELDVNHSIAGVIKKRILFLPCVESGNYHRLIEEGISSSLTPTEVLNYDPEYPVTEIVAFTHVTVALRWKLEAKI